MNLQALDGELGNVLWSYKGKHLLDDLSSDCKHFYVYDKIDEGVISLDVYSGGVKSTLRRFKNEKGRNTKENNEIPDT